MYMFLQNAPPTQAKAQTPFAFPTFRSHFPFINQHSPPFPSLHFEARSLPCRSLNTIITTAMRILLLILLLSSSAAFAQKGVQTITIRTSAVCDMCKERIEKEMAFTKGVTAAALDVKTAVLTVSYKASKTDPASIRKALNAIGYDADDSPADPKAYEDLHHCCKKDSH
jgi:periplasmic mercuric ion binding protein